MGIDIYLRWPGQTQAEQGAQYTGFSTTSGNVGYLREAYHGGPYATRVLVPESFDETLYVGNADNTDDGSDPYGVPIPAATLRERLAETIRTVKQRYVYVYNQALEDDAPALQAYRDFVDLAERKEHENGTPCRVLNSY